MNGDFTFSTLRRFPGVPPPCGRVLAAGHLNGGGDAEVRVIR
jgi:hypothetical protein